MYRWIWMFAIFYSSLCLAQRPSERELRKETTDLKIKTLADGCANIPLHQRDQICDALVELKNVGDDAIESIKATIKLSPTEYTLLTAANAIATGRLRVKTQAPLMTNAWYVFDLKKDSSLFSLEKNF